MGREIQFQSYFGSRRKNSFNFSIDIDLFGTFKINIQSA